MFEYLVTFWSLWLAVVLLDMALLGRNLTQAAVDAILAAMVFLSIYWLLWGSNA